MKDSSTGVYDPRKPHRLLDTVRRRHNLKTDKALADKIAVQQSVISRIRAGTMAVTPFVILQIHDATGMAVKDIKALMPAAERA